MAHEDMTNLTMPDARENGKYKPLTPEQRARKQSRFLAAYRKSANIKHSCAVAGISRTTFREWRDNDESFKSQLPDAQDDARDVLEQAAYDRAVQGVPSFVVSQGRMVYEEIPVLNADGTPKLDPATGKQVVLRGKPLVERKYSDSLLTVLLKANMPEKYKERHEHSGPDNGPMQFEGLVIDTRDLTDEELALLKTIALAKKEREA